MSFVIDFGKIQRIIKVVSGILTHQQSGYNTSEQSDPKFRKKFNWNNIVLSVYNVAGDLFDDAKIGTLNAFRGHIQYRSYDLIAQ